MTKHPSRSTNTPFRQNMSIFILTLFMGLGAMLIERLGRKDPRKAKDDYYAAYEAEENPKPKRS